MKFVFPQNYSFKSKILGFIDYTTAIADCFWIILVFGIINILPFNINFKIFLFIVLVLPILIISIIGFYGESIVNVSYYLIKYLLRPKVLLYEKK